MVVVTVPADAATPAATCVVLTVAVDHLVCEARADRRRRVRPRHRAYRVLHSDRRGGPRTARPASTVPTPRSRPGPSQSWRRCWSRRRGRRGRETRRLLPGAARRPGRPRRWSRGRRRRGHRRRRCCAASPPRPATAPVTSGWDSARGTRLDFGDPTPPWSSSARLRRAEPRRSAAVSNTTDGTRCVVAAATRDPDLRDAAGADGDPGATTGPGWDAGDAWEVGGLGVVAADLELRPQRRRRRRHGPDGRRLRRRPRRQPDRDLPPPSSAAEMVTGPRTTAPADQRRRGRLRAAVGADRPGPDGEFPEGRFLGTLGFAATAAAAPAAAPGTPRPVTITEGIESLEAARSRSGSTWPASPSSSSATRCSRSSTAPSPTSRCRCWATTPPVESWLDPALDELTFQLDEALPGGVAPAGATVGDVDGDGAGTAGLEGSHPRGRRGRRRRAAGLLPSRASTSADPGRRGDAGVRRGEVRQGRRLGEVDDMGFTSLRRERRRRHRPGRGLRPGLR